MRFYKVVIWDKDGLVLVPNYNGQPGFTHVEYNDNLATYTSLNSNMHALERGSTNPAALRVELDIGLTALDGPAPNSVITIHGTSLAEIAQASNLNGLGISVLAGFAAGLPLANPSQSGKVAGGQIIQSYGNRIGIDQSLTIFIGASGSSPDASQTTGKPGTILAPVTNDTPANLTFQWQEGQPLMSPLANTLTTAFPQYNIVGAVNPGLVWSGAASTGYYKTLGQLAQFIRQKSISMIDGYAPNPIPGPGTYPGVSLALFDNTITVSDGTTQPPPKQIQFIELVGQPTWSQPFAVQVCCPMRADIRVGDYVLLPNAPGITTQGSSSQYFNPNPYGGGYADQKSGSIFSGTFQVIAVRHVGDSRDPGFTSWVTTIDMILASTPQYVQDSLPFVYQSSSGNKYGFTI